MSNEIQDDYLGSSNPTIMDEVQSFEYSIDFSHPHHIPVTGVDQYDYMNNKYVRYVFQLIRYFGIRGSYEYILPTGETLGEFCINQIRRSQKVKHGPQH